LKPEMTYYVVAYATNNLGTTYSTAVGFTTSEGIIRKNDMVNIPAGTFTMGSPSTEVDRRTNETQHQVTLSAFRMSKYEITNKQFADFLNENHIGSNGFSYVNPYGYVDFINESSGNDDFGLHYNSTEDKWVPVSGCENWPVINVHWYGASEFAKYVGGALPTEAQWEYACRAGMTTPFNTGDFLTNLQANYNWALPYNNGTNTVTTSPGKTQTVGSYPPNAFGLCDMHGNAFEWCNDWYADYTTTEQTDPTGGVSGLYRVFRGGAWNYPAYYLRSAFRNYAYPYHSSSNIGFRVVFVP